MEDVRSLLLPEQDVCGLSLENAMIYCMDRGFR